MNQNSADATARDLERRYFRLMNEANQPDVVWDEDGPRWGDTYTTAESPELNAAVDAAEQELYEFLREHRSELEATPKWEGYYFELDAESTDAELEAER